MKVCDVCLTPDVARPGMLVRDVFHICVASGVPAIPFHDEHNQPTGWISLRNIMTHGCIPEYVVELAHVLGDNLACLEDSTQKIETLLKRPVEGYVRSPLRSISSQAPLMKAIAIMQKYETSYMFVYDGNAYRGMVTTVGLAKRMLGVEGQMMSMEM